MKTRSSVVAGVFGTCVVLASFSGHANAAQPGFWILPRTETTIHLVSGISADGEVVAGTQRIPATDTTLGYKWTRTGGIQTYSVDPAVSSVGGISSDGMYAVGWAYEPVKPQFRAFRRNLTSGTNELLPIPAGHLSSIGRAASGDGRVVVGAAEYKPTGFPRNLSQPYVWTPETGSVAIGSVYPGNPFGTARGVSRDGATIVGESVLGAAINAFVWRRDDGIKALPGFGQGGEQTIAYLTSADGRVIIGDYTSFATPSSIIRWIDGKPDLLGVPFSTNPANIQCMSPDGSMFGGYFNNGTGGQTAFIWTAELGYQNLDDYLAPFNLSLPSGTKLATLAGVSDDLTTFTGYYTNGEGNYQGYVVTIPTPHVAVVGPIMWMGLRRRRLACDTRHATVIVLSKYTS